MSNSVVARTVVCRMEVERFIMAMEEKNGNCPRLGSDISFEVQYNEENGTIEYVDCSCSEMICCMEYDEEQCPKIWIDFFNAAFGTTVEPSAVFETEIEPVSEQGPAEQEASEQGDADESQNQEPPPESE